MLNHSGVTQSVTDAWTDIIIANAVFNYMAWPVTKLNEIFEQKKKMKSAMI